MEDDDKARRQSSVQSQWHNPDKQRILDAVDLADLVGEQLPLKRAGREFKVVCPFHDDTNPSMYVNPQKGIFKCFACGAGGNALTWMEKYFHMTRGEAWKFLSERTGIELPAFNPSSNARRTSPRSQSTDPNTGDIEYSEADPAAIVEAHKTALSFYRAILKHEEHGSTARTIYAERGINQEMIERFDLGATPGGDRWDGLVATLAARQIELKPFLDSGLISTRKSGNGHFDRFRNRLIFPIHDLLGRPIAFGARQIAPDDDPKYLNSPEHAKFNKSSTLYGIHLAQRNIQTKSQAVVVEGYTDVIACHQYGCTNAVATLGTALTRDHARILQRLCEQVVLVFDGDTAGRKAADRAVEIFFQTNIDMSIALLPDGQDPADVLSGPNGLATFEEIIANAAEALEYLLDSFRENLKNPQHANSVSSRQRIIEDFLNRLGALGFHRMAPLRKNLTLGRIADLVDMPREMILQSIPQPRRTLGRTDKATAGSPHDDSFENDFADEEHPPKISPMRRGLRDAERGILGCLIFNPRILLALDDATATTIREIKWQIATHAALAPLIMEWIEAVKAEKMADSLPNWDDEALNTLANDLYWEISHQATNRSERWFIELLTQQIKSIQMFAAEQALTTLKAPSADSLEQTEPENEPSASPTTSSEVAGDVFSRIRAQQLLHADGQHRRRVILRTGQANE